MFCYQCEQTAKGTGCTKVGVCGKNEDVASLQDALIIGLKGVAAYSFHARELGERDEEIDAFMHDALFTTLTNVNFDLNNHVEKVLELGKMNYKAMEMLDRANVNNFGTPGPTQVSTGFKPGPAVLITGHDFLDMYELLKQAEQEGVNVYTHGEMLPAHAYPELKKFSNLAGHYGSAWQNQKSEFEQFPGAILGTTNCVLHPKDSYKDRMFTCGIARLPEVTHISDRNFKEVIEKAKECGPLPEKEGSTLTTGFHHTPVLELAGKIVEAVKAGKIRHFFLVGGCDGSKQSRSYYTEFAKQVPEDCVILTLGCGKYRLNHLDLGEIDGIPRLLDMGQCNNAYSALQVASALADAFNCSINELPLSLVLSWFEQKAVSILFTLLDLGVQNIRVGPSVPAFLTPNVLQVIQENYNLKPISTPEEDLQEMLG